MALHSPFSSSSLEGGSSEEEEDDGHLLSISISSAPDRQGTALCFFLLTGRGVDALLTWPGGEVVEAVGWVC